MKHHPSSGGQAPQSNILLDNSKETLPPNERFQSPVRQLRAKPYLLNAPILPKNIGLKKKILKQIIPSVKFIKTALNTMPLAYVNYMTRPSNNIILQTQSRVHLSGFVASKKGRKKFKQRPKKMVNRTIFRKTGNKISSLFSTNLPNSYDNSLSSIEAIFGIPIVPIFYHQQTHFDPFTTFVEDYNFLPNQVFPLVLKSKLDIPSDKSCISLSDFSEPNMFEDQQESIYSHYGFHNNITGQTFDQSSFATLAQQETNMSDCNETHSCQHRFDISQ